MILVAHIIVAITSVVFTAFTALYPTQTKFRFSGWLIALMFLSGTALVILKDVSLVHACAMGLIYLGIMLSAMTVIHRKLALQEN
jgi:hypothetical protein